MERLEGRWRARVIGSPVGRLATVRPDGTPHVVPITFALVGERFVTAIDHKPKSTTDVQRLRNIQVQPRVSILVDHYDEDWSSLWWARADGRARIVAASAAARELDALVAAYPPYRHRRPDGPVIVVEVERWASWEAEATG